MIVKSLESVSQALGEAVGGVRISAKGFETSRGTKRLSCRYNDPELAVVLGQFVKSGREAAARLLDKYIGCSSTCTHRSKARCPVPEIVRLVRYPETNCELC